MANTSGNADRLSHGSQGGMEGISELLRCYICMERLSDATICPHCSKLGCFNCIQRWITDNRSNCPHCRMTLTLRDLIKIPLFDDLGQYLDTLRTSKKPGSSSPTGERERCSKHKEKMTVYCESCKMCICHVCALFGGNHSEHKFKPLEDLYKGVIDKLNLELHRLKDRMKEVLNNVQIIEKKMDAVKATKSKTKREMQHCVDKLCGKLDDQAKEKLSLLSEQRHNLKKQALEIASQSHDLERIMAEGNVASLIGMDGELKAEVKQMLQKLCSSSFQLRNLPSSSDFINELTPTYDSGVFKIHPFRRLQLKGEELYSKPMKVHGQTWRLKVYPNGHREDNGVYLSVFMELYEGFERTSKYQYCIEMLYNGGNKHPHKNHKREYGSEFANGECWGYKKYYELGRLQSEGFLKDDTLVLRFSVRAPTYYHKCRDLTEYLEKVEQDNESLKKELDTMKQQVTKLKHTIQTSANNSPTHSSSSAHISSRRSHSQSQHQNEPLRHSHERQASDELRRYYQHSASQQPMRSHSHHASPKRSYLQPSGHSDSRLHPDHHYPGGLVVVGRRSSREEHENQRYIDQRRRSADPAVMMTYDHQAAYRGPNTQPNAYLPPAMAELTSNKDKHGNRPLFEDAGGDEGNSQSCDVIAPANITFTVEESAEDTKSASSTSTLVENSSGTPPRQQQLEIVTTPKQLSQEMFAEDERPELVPLSTVCEEVPLSPKPMYYEPAFSQGPSYYGLSQASPPKSRHGKSLTDINAAASAATAMTMAGGGSNLLAVRQCLSQSVDLSHFNAPGQQRYATDSLPRHTRMLAPPGALKHAQSFQHNQIHRMASDSHLNYEGPPGQKQSMMTALSRTREEIEQKKQAQQQRRGQNHTRKQFKSHYLQKKHVQATVVSQTAVPKTSNTDKSSPKHRPERSPSTLRTQKQKSGNGSSNGNGPSSSSKVAEQSSSLSSSTKGKSKSTSSLNLQLL